MLNTQRLETQFGDLPVILRLRKLLKSGESRRGELRKRLEGLDGSPRSLAYDASELRFVNAALIALAYHEAILDDDTSPVTALEDILEELEELGLPAAERTHDRLRRIMARSRRILRALAL